jgi:hypothetical protein
MSSDSRWRRAPADSSRRQNDRIDQSANGGASDGRAPSFARAKFLWLDQVCDDPELTPLGFRLAYVLANLVNERQGYESWLRKFGQ